MTPTPADAACIFGPANEPWMCSVHVGGIRTNLTETRCRRPGSHKHTLECPDCLDLAVTAARLDAQGEAEAAQRPLPAEPTLDDFPVGAVLASALMAANYPGDSGEDVDRLIHELYERGYSLQPMREPTLDVDDWNNIMEALEVASSYPQEMQVNRERWVATLARVESRAPAEPTLDVERLDAALDRLNVGAAGWPTADAIAREYARLATEDKPA